MRRFVYLCLIVALLPWIVIGIVRESTDDDTKDHYFVRAIFDNASTLVNGEDVKVAGVPVGVISDLDVTPDNKAAVTLRIDDKGFIPWKSDAKCKIGSQGLIGEKFVDCQPGSSSAEPLARVEEGDGKGERLLPIEQTSSPVDLDLLNDIMRLPYRERLAILLSEFGAGLAGRGEELNEVIHRANPALRETDEVLKILADQNRVLARLARDSDRALAPTRARARVVRRLRGPGQRDRRGLGRAARRSRPQHPPASRLPARAAPADGGPRGLHRPGHAGVHRPERRRTGPRTPDRGAGHARRRIASRASRASATRSSAVVPR